MSRYLCASIYFHAASGLHLAMYRVYDAELGRWLSRDPIEENGGLNLYAYCNNDPLNCVDLPGLDAVFLVGRNKTDPNFFSSKAKAYAQGYEAANPGKKAFVFEVRSKEDIQSALKTKNIDKLQYLGHAGQGSLFLSDQELNKNDVSSLDAGNIEEDAEISLLGCDTAAGEDSIAQAFANHFNRDVIGIVGGLSLGVPVRFGASEDNVHLFTAFPGFPRGTQKVVSPKGPQNPPQTPE